MNLMKYLTGLSAVLAVSAVMIAPLNTNAGWRPGERGYKYRSHSGYSGVYRHVRAESASSFRSVVAPVRRGPVGDQVLVPGGAWHDCEISCEYTLRRVYLDFWEDQGDNFTSPGYFTFNFYLD